MNKLWVAVLIIVLILAGYYLWGSSGSSRGADLEGGSGAMNLQVDAEAFTGSLGDLVMRGGDYECVIKTSTAGLDTAGKVYVSGSKVRGEFMSEVGGEPMASYMVQDGGYTYVWSSAFPQGFKTATPAVAEGITKPVAMSGDFFDASLDYSWDCKSWQANPDVFAVPTNISFMETPIMAQ